MELNNELPSDLKTMYPFKSNFLDIDKNKLHYVDEGSGSIIVMVHGNPTWSFYYRHLITELSKDHRVIAIDHMGCGLSDKPQGYEYTLQNRVKDLTSLIDSLNIESYSLIVHDWGGAIGMGHAVDHVANINKIVLLNTAAFRSKKIPFSINICKLKGIGPWMVKHLNSFCYPATFMTTEKGLSEDVKKGYLAPYDTAKNRIAISEFVQDIPLHEGHRSYQYLVNIERRLSNLKGKKLILWGGKDFCFNDTFYNRWKIIYPDAEFKYYPEAGHYVIEDEKDDTLKMIVNFFKD